VPLTLNAISHVTMVKHTLYCGAYINFSAYFSHFLTDLVEILYMKSPQNYAGLCNFREIRCIGNQTSINSVKYYLTLLHIYCTVWVIFCMCNSHEMLLDTQDFRKNQRRRFCTSVKGVNGIEFKSVPHNQLLRWK